MRNDEKLIYLDCVTDGMKKQKARLSSNGQVVIPSKIRSDMCLERGTEFRVTIQDASIVLTPLGMQRPAHDAERKEESGDISTETGTDESF